MTKAYTDTDFSARITEDLTWRIREISDLKAAIRRADANLCKVLLRALVTLAYAHWEGYVKFSATLYLEYVARRKHKYVDLNKQFLRNYFLPRFAALSVSKTSIAERCDLVDKILNAENERFSRVSQEVVNTKANLNSQVFADICLVCGVAAESFSDKATFIDVMLLKRRNGIAHGEDTLVSAGELDSIANNTIELMRTFGNALENHVVEQTFRAA